MVKWPKRYSWTDPHGTSRLVRVLEPLSDRADTIVFSDSQRVEVEDVNTRKRFPNVLFKTLALIE